MAHRFHKHKLLPDENFPDRTTLPRLNGLFDVKHVKVDLRLGGLPDPQVSALAVQLQRVVVTFNVKDFFPLVGTKPDCGVIGVSTGLTREQIDKKLTALLVRSTPHCSSHPGPLPV